MAANHHHHQILHELLKQEQEPFHLNTYINTKRSKLQKQKINNNTQFLDDLKSKNVPVLIHIPSNTAALLIEAASKIQKNSANKKRSKDEGFLGSFLKKRALVKDHRNKKSTFALRISDEEEEGHHGRGRDVESRFFWCSLGFSFRRRNASTFCSSVDYSSKQDSKIINAHKRSSNVRRDQAESEGNEHSSPTSVLEQHFFEEDDEQRQSDDAKEDDDSHLESSYANVQRVKETLLKRLRRFEELAELDPMEFDHIRFVEGNIEEEEEITSKIEENQQNNNLSTETTTSTGNNKRVFFGGVFKTKNDAIIDTMVELELKCHNGSWRLFNEQVDDVAQVIEREMFELLIDELLCERVL